MNQWAFVIAAYGVTLVAVGGMILASWLGMRRSEARLDELSRR